jgi:hypothetical protein
MKSIQKNLYVDSVESIQNSIQKSVLEKEYILKDDNDSGVLEKEYIVEDDNDSVATFDTVELNQVFGEAELFNNPSIYSRPLPSDILTRAVWILHFYNYSTTTTAELELLHEESQHSDTVVIVIQLQQGISHQSVVEQCHRLDENIVLVNDVHLDFDKLVRRSVDVDLPCYMMIVHSVFRSMGPSVGSPLFQGFPNVNSLHPFKQPQWVSPQLGSDFFFSDYFNDSTAYLPHSPLFTPSPVVIIHIWSLFCDKSIRLWKEYVDLPRICQFRFSHVAVHIDPKEEPAEEVLDAAIGFRHGLVSIRDVDKRFKDYWYACGYLMVPSTMIIIHQKLAYVGSIHTCIPESVPALIDHLLEYS